MLYPLLSNFMDYGDDGKCKTTLVVFVMKVSDLQGVLTSISANSYSLLFRVWPALMTALHFNLNNHLYYPLLINFMGYGDKETFAFALIAHSIPFHVVQHRVRGLGVIRGGCDSPPCHRGNTMVQHNSDGATRPPVLPF